MEQIPYLPKEQQDLILSGPALAPPDGVSQFDNPPNNNSLAHGVIALCTTVATICFLLRIYTKGIFLKKIDLEDYLVLGAYGTYVGYVYACYKLMNTSGYFIHQWDIRLRDLIPISYILFVGGVLYSVTLPLLKAAIVTEWARIFVPGHTRNFFWCACYAVMAVQMSFMIASVISLCFTCIPHEKIWDITVKGACIEKTKLEIASASIHLASDIVILVLPQKVIWGLQMSRKQKMGVSVVFSFGIFACVAAAFRLAVTVYYSTAADVTYSVASVILWALAEMTCGFLVICMPTAPKALLAAPILTQIRASLKSWSAGRSSMKNTEGANSESSHTLSKSSNPNSSYRKLDEFGVPLGDLENPLSESQEQLQQQYAKKPEGTIVRTTRVTRTEDFDFDGEVGDDQLNRQHPWRSS